MNPLNRRSLVSLALRTLFLPLAFVLLSVPGCGGGETASPSASVASAENWARLREFTLAPGVLRRPATAIEQQNLRVDYLVDFQSNTHLPTFQLVGHLLPKGEALLSPDSGLNRVVVQFCGQQAYACGEPFTRLCTLTVGWLDQAKRRLQCGAGDPAVEVAPGPYVFVASACYTDSKGTRVCNSISRDVVLQ